MKRFKTKRILQAVTIALAILTLVSIVLLIISPKDVIETTTEIISVIVGVIALAVAIISQVSANKEERRLRGIITELHDIIRNNQTDIKLSTEMNRKLDELIHNKYKKK